MKNTLPKLDPISCVYLLENTLNGKKYVGSTKDFDKRIKEHERKLRSGKHVNAHLQNSYNLYGNVFVFYVQEVVAPPDLLEREEFWIRDLKPEYNIGSVGGGDNISNHPNKEAIVRKIRTSLLMRYKGETKEDKANRSKSRLGNLNPNWKGGVSKCCCGKGVSRGYTQCKSCSKLGDKNSFYGKKHSEKTRKILSQKALGRLPSNSRGVIIEGIRYTSISAGARGKGVTPSTIINRINYKGEEWDEYRYED